MSGENSQYIGGGVQTHQLICIVWVRFRVLSGMSYRDTAGFIDIFVRLLACAYFCELLKFITKDILLPQKVEVVTKPVFHFSSALVSDFDDFVIIKHRVANHIVLLSVARLSINRQS